VKACGGQLGETPGGRAKLASAYGETPPLRGAEHMVELTFPAEFPAVRMHAYTAELRHPSAGLDSGDSYIHNSPTATSTC
jgi:hypothetical protein